MCHHDVMRRRLVLVTSVGLIIGAVCSVPATAAGARPPASIDQMALTALGERPLDWRTVLVAGDDSVAAFDNGITAIAAELGERGVTDVVELRASAGNATAASVGAAIEGLEAGEGDGCLVYLTSHGSEDGVLLSNDASASPDALLDPDELTTMLDRGCGRAPTVLVVSACHSGTFLTHAMTQPNRIVITAARTDRTSFGCSDEYEFTFFDECVITAIPDADDWSAFYDDVDRCVEAKETDLDVTPSEPQMFEGTSVDDLALPESLIAWLKAQS